MRDKPIVIHWFRRDLRWHDNTALWSALHSPYPVLPLFIFDTDILATLSDVFDRRVDFIHRQVQQLYDDMANKGCDFLVMKGKPLEIWKQLLENYSIEAVYTNNDYEPYAKQRDQQVSDLLQSKGIAFYSYKDHVIFEKNDILKPNHKPYTVFTPYSRVWLALFEQKETIINGDALALNHFYSNPKQHSRAKFPSLASIGFKQTDIAFKPIIIDEQRIYNYAAKRDMLAEAGTSQLSVAIRFGTISIRTLALLGKKLSNTWLNELIWRDFYQAILWHFPQVIKQAFKPVYDQIRWRNNENEFDAWCAGKTGYPIVDAAMRQLNQCGFMHNRLRMVTASFLVKHLLIDWRWGEAYFAQKLIDYDLAANNGGWQWAASSGCDAVPYFRIFNPIRQAEKFDKQQLYVKKWIPELDTNSYPKPVVAHDLARERALAVYKKAINTSF